MKFYRSMKRLSNVMNQVGIVVLVVTVIIAFCGGLIYNGTTKERVTIVAVSLIVLAAYSVISLIVGSAAYIARLVSWNKIRQSSELPWSWDFPEE